MPINRSKFSKIFIDLSKAGSVGPSFSKKIRKTGLQIMRQKFEGYRAKQISNKSTTQTSNYYYLFCKNFEEMQRFYQRCSSF